MKRKRDLFVLLLCFCLLILPAGEALGRSLEKGTGHGGHEGKKTRAMTYGDLSQDLYKLVYKKGDQDLEKLGRASHEEPGLAWLRALGLVDDRFRQDDPVTRREGIYILHGLYRRLDTKKEDQGPRSSFKDAAKLDPSYQAPLSWVENQGLFIGNEKKEICPDQLLSKEDFTRVLGRGHDLFENKKICRPIFFNPYEIKRIEIRSRHKPGLNLTYTGPDQVEDLRRILNSLEGEGCYRARTQWTNQVRVYTQTGARLDYYIFWPLVQVKSLAFESAQNKNSFRDLEGYLVY